MTEQLVFILSVQQCALCIVGHVSSCCITASARYNVAVPTQADEDNWVMNYDGK